MSQDKSPHPLKHGDFIKKILHRPEKVRSPSEWFDETGKYIDEQGQEYREKKAQFMAAVETYIKVNVETPRCRKIRLNRNYEQALDLEFLKEKEGPEEDCEPNCVCPKCQPNRTGRLLRKRNIRPIRQYLTEPELCVCKIEPWFKRYLILNKFIWAARTIVIRNRLLKVLNKLKAFIPKPGQKFDETVFKKKCEDYHCHPVFEKFL